MVVLLSFCLGYFLLVNVLTWVAFRLDKQRALAAKPRIPERHLLMLAALGGSPAAHAARQRFRHKTQKQPFSSKLRRIVRIQRDVSVPFVALTIIALVQIYLTSNS